MGLSKQFNPEEDVRSHDAKRREFTDGLMIEPSFVAKIRTRITVECWGDNDHHAWQQLNNIAQQMDVDVLGRFEMKAKDSYFNKSDVGYAICKVERLEDK